MRNIKRLIAFIIVLLALFAVLGVTDVYAVAFSTDIRVLISTSSKSIDITAIGDYYLKEDPDFKLDSDKMNISITGSRPVLTSAGEMFTASTITFLSRDYEGTSSYIRLKNSKYGTCTYLGNITFNVSEGRIRAINTLPIEHYLYGVVPYEMSNTFPMESLKAQAVCARGYATANCSKNRLRDYDILDTSADQVYHGYASKYTRAIAAVDETAGQVMTYGGDIIQAYYSASNGGQTERTGNVWVSDLPYYVQRDDIYDVANPSSLEEKSFIPLEFNDETLPLMDALVLDKLKTGANEAAGGEVALLSTVRVKAYDAKYAPPSRCYKKADVVLMTEDARGVKGQITVTLSLGELVSSDENPEGIFNSGNRTLRMRGAEYGVIEAQGKEYEGWFLTNRRYGHGIGLSQRGAQQRATGGQSFSEILSFYYADTMLCTIGTFETAPALKSGLYKVTKSFISGIKPGATAEKLLSGLSSEGSVSIISSRGTVKKGKVSTGDFVRTVYGGGSSYFDLPLVIYGDTDGDGNIAKSDAYALQQHLLNTNMLSGVYLEAADVNRDGAVDGLDALRIMKHIQGERSIEQK